MHNNQDPKTNLGKSREISNVLAYMNNYFFSLGILYIESVAEDFTDLNKISVAGNVIFFKNFQYLNSVF